ncbi:MAG TPA: DNA translocase FtsK 4TM domain-containing protein [Nitrospirales bacterium]|nr:DNA translocase FtsK 4TM domain-containing protein [Nitrospirales bacterium]
MSKSGAAGTRHEMAGVVLLTLALLLGLSLLSYSPRDPILFEQSFHPESVHNLIGRVGMTLATVVFAAVGGGSYLAPIALGILGSRCFLRGGLGVTLRSAGGFTALLLFLSMLLALHVPGVPTISSGWVQEGLAGGRVGGALSGLLVMYFATVGTHIVLIAGLLLSVLVATPFSLVALGQQWAEMTATLREWAQERWSQFQAWAGEKPKRVKAKPVKIIRLKPVLPVETEIVQAADGAETVEPAPLSQPAYRRRKRKLAITDHRSAQLVLPQVMDGAGYVLPDPAVLLRDPAVRVDRVTDEEIRAQAQVLTQALANFGIDGQVVQTHVGPVVTMYEFEPAPGVKVARIVNLADDLALAMRATSIRIVAPIPGKSVVGIEVPNPRREDVMLKELVLSEAYSGARSLLKLALGKDIFGTPVVADLRSMPHLLVAGATGSGKSVGLNTMILSLLFAARPDEVKFLLIDPKMLELTVYEDIPHLWRPVITQPKAASRGLMLAVKEMDRRYKLMAEYGARNIDAYNRAVAEAQGVPPPQPLETPEGEVVPGTEPQPAYLSEEERLALGETAAPGGPEAQTPPAPLPYLVIVIDELADLMMVASKEVEDSITKLAQMARAAGIHLILATQRPSVDVLTGLIKANFPARIAFQVASKTDSRTILDQNGADQLLGRGDMLYLATGSGKLIRVHGAYVPEGDLRKVVEFVKAQGSPAFAEEAVPVGAEAPGDDGERDEMYEKAKEIVTGTGQASASFLQRRLRIGYPRAARMIEMMEQDGIVGAMSRDGRREVLVKRVGVDEGL